MRALPFNVVSHGFTGLRLRVYGFSGLRVSGIRLVLLEVFAAWSGVKVRYRRLRKLHDRHT